MFQPSFEKADLGIRGSISGVEAGAAIRGQNRIASPHAFSDDAVLTPDLERERAAVGARLAQW